MPDISNAKELNIPNRTLLGPGPSDIHPRVLKAMATPILGYLDPDFLKVMDEVMNLLRPVFGSQNWCTFPIQATGGAGMETSLCNILEPGDEIIVGLNGFFSARICEIADRCQAKVHIIKADWGRIIEPSQIEDALKKFKAKIVAIVHAETSTGILQPLDEVGKIVNQHGAFFLVDAVTSLGGTAIDLDKNHIDICYSCTQKCLGAPPGLSPISFSERALEAVRNRKTKVQSWYFDIELIAKYWREGDRTYHHTSPASMILALHEALKIVHEEGLRTRFERHETNAKALRAGLEAMGLNLLAQKGYQAPMLTSVGIPDGISDMNIRKKLLTQYALEIGGGLGEFRSKAWRIGLMGYSSSRRNVLYCLSALEQALSEEGYRLEKGAALAAANAVY